MMKYQHCPIQTSETFQKSLGSNHYKDFSFYDVWRQTGGRSGHENFINYDCITFKDFVGNYLITGNELLFYPELTPHLQAIKEYPILSRTYPIQRDHKGLAFIAYFHQHVMACHQDFLRELAQASSVINNLVKEYGMKRYTPLLAAIPAKDMEHTYPRQLIINGIAWKLLSDRYTESNVTSYVDLNRLLNLPYEASTSIEDIRIGTPFLAIRSRKTYKHTGKVHWYSLDSLQKVCQSDMDNWKPL